MYTKQSFKNNWQIKLLAIITAIFLWLYVGITRNVGEKPLLQKPDTPHSGENHRSGK